MAEQETHRLPSGEEQSACWCGCGGATKSRFVRGHDAKFHGLAKKVARGQTAIPEAFVHDDAKADFLRHHDAEKAAMEVKAAEEAAKVGATTEPSFTKPPREGRVRTG